MKATVVRWCGFLLVLTLAVRVLWRSSALPVSDVHSVDAEEFSGESPHKSNGRGADASSAEVSVSRTSLSAVDLHSSESSPSALSKSSADLEVLVAWSDGRPAAGAEVRLVELSELYTIHANATADFNGRVHLNAAPRPAVVYANLDEFESLPIPALPGRPITLTLLATAAAEGVFRPTNELSDAQMTITCIALDGARRIELGSRKGSVTTPWRMERIPIPPGGRLRFRFLSESTLACELERLVSVPGEVVRFDLELRRGYQRQVSVVDMEGHPIDDAEVVAAYTNSYGDVVLFSGRTDPEGQCRLSGVPPREGDLTARKPGFAVSPYGWPIHGLLPDDEVWEISMERSVPVKGRCVANGVSVEDFDIVWWPENGYRVEVRQFRDATEGEFELLEIGRGSTTLTAVSDAHGQSQPTQVRVAEDPVDGVILEFPAKAVVEGQVVDALTELPIANAAIQPWAVSLGRNLSPRGWAAFADANGHFRSESFNAGINRIEVSAPGYSSCMRGVFVESGRNGNAGVIRLAHSQSLRVKLRCGAEYSVPECYVSGASAASVLPPQGFDANGVTTYEGVAPGDWKISTTLSSGYQLQSDLSCPPGVDWLLDVNAERLKDWSVAVVDANGRSAIEGFAVRLLWLEGQTPTHLGFYLLDGPAVPILAPHGLSSVLQVLGPDRTLVYQACIGQDDYKQDPFVVRVSDASTSFYVRDGRSAPLGGATVYSLLPGFPFESTTSAVSASDGSVRIVAPEVGSVDVAVTHPTLGMAAFIGLKDSDRRAGVYSLELDPVGPLEVFVRDGAAGVAGAELGLGMGGYWISRPRTDARGLARTLPLNAGAWRLRFDQPGYWPAEGEFVLKKDSKPFELQVRALGDLEIEVRSSAGLAVESCELELESEEFHELASDWLAQGRIRSSMGALRTDRFGKLTLNGLPHGEYAWSAISNGEVLASGGVAIAARALTNVVARLP